MPNAAFYISITAQATLWRPTQGPQEVLAIESNNDSGYLLRTIGYKIYIKLIIGPNKLTSDFVF